MDWRKGKYKLFHYNFGISYIGEEEERGGRGKRKKEEKEKGGSSKEWPAR